MLHIVMLCVVFIRRLLPVQTNTDEHDPEFCRDNYSSNVTFPNGTTAEIVTPECSTYPEFEGAPPTVIIVTTG